MEARSDQLAHAPALHPAFYRAIHPVAVIRRVRALVAVFQDGDCPEEFPAVVRSVCPALPVEFPEARSASCFALAVRFCTHFYLAIDAECSIDREREAALTRRASFVFGPLRGNRTVRAPWR